MQNRQHVQNYVSRLSNVVCALAMSVFFLQGAKHAARRCGQLSSDFIALNVFSSGVHVT